MDTKVLYSVILTVVAFILMAAMLSPIVIVRDEIVSKPWWERCEYYYEDEADVDPSIQEQFELFVQTRNMEIPNADIYQRLLRIIIYYYAIDEIRFDSHVFRDFEVLCRDFPEFVLFFEDEFDLRILDGNFNFVVHPNNFLTLDAIASYVLKNL